MAYLNRDISFLSFNKRVSDEMYKNIPLGDKVMFQGITFSNLTEFVQVRYPSACEFEEGEPLNQLAEAIKDHYNTISHRFEKFNKKQKIVRSIGSLTKKEFKWVEKYFKESIYPTLQTISFDRSKKLNLHAGFYVMVVYELDGDETFGYIEIPKEIPRFIQVNDSNYVIAVEDLIRRFIKKLFLNTHNCQVMPFCIARSAEVYVNMDEYTDPFTMIKQTLKERDKAWITYVEMGDLKSKACKILEKLLPLTSNTIIVGSKYVHMQDLKKIPQSIYPIEDKMRKYEPINTFPVSQSIFSYIRKEDRLAFHPYESYQTSTVRLLEEAASDDDVVSIKIALYRVSDNSKIIDALLKAADKGKLVTVLIELKARFDEHHNIEISNILREGGVRIMFTKPNIKTHAKVCLITRKEKGGIRIYSHVGTGNYSESNSKQYTDYSYFSADMELGKDLTQFFNLLTSNQGTFKSRRIIYAPYNMRDELEHQIDKQVKLAKKGRKARIIAKCNSLTDTKMADKLMDAAKAGVKITLIVRGACIMEPTKNIKIYSLVGMYLEHSRLYSFGYGKKTVVYIGSSDLMLRSFEKRNELLIKIENREIQKRLMCHVNMYLSDTTNMRVIEPGYKYSNIKVKKNKTAYNSQKEFYKEAKKLEQ